LFGDFNKRKLCKKEYKMSFLKRKRGRGSSTQTSNSNTGSAFSNLKENIEALKTALQSPSDLIIREFYSGKLNHPCALICIDGMVAKNIVNQMILKSILDVEIDQEVNGNELLDLLEKKVLATLELKRTNNLDLALDGVMSGDTALFVDNSTDFLLIGSSGFESRAVEEPQTEALIRGPRDGFTENILTNTSLIRRRMKDPTLKFDSYTIGRRSKQSLIIAYVDSIVNPAIVKEVKKRIESIDIEDAPESGTIEQWIEDSFLSPFPQLLHSERPDKITSAMLQGKVAILLDGTPFVLIVPITLGQLLQSPEDYYERWIMGSLIRMLRYLAAFLALFLPALYICLLEYHPGLIPSKLAFSIAGARDGVPFPAVMEALIMEVTLELLREAGVRLPKPIGQTIGVVGGLVIGEAAVTAGVVSPIMVIVVAVTAISSFAIPAYSIAIAFRIIRFGIMIAAAIFGFYGVIFVYILINIHIVNLNSFGVPYSTPFAPLPRHDWKDLIVRLPLMFLNKRPAMMKTKDLTRLKKENGNE
jgi:spore germination protein